MNGPVQGRTVSLIRGQVVVVIGVNTIGLAITVGIGKAFIYGIVAVVIQAVTHFHGQLRALPRDTGPLTDPGLGASAAVGNQDMLATGIPEAVIEGTPVAVIAVLCRPAHAATTGTCIADGAKIGIIARGRVGQMCATHLGVTLIVRTQIAVVTIQGHRPRTLPEVAGIPQCTDVAVITWRFVENGLTARFGIARVIGTDIVIPTFQDPGKETLPAAAIVALGTRIAVITVAGRRRVDAANFGRAFVCGARILVVAGHQLAALTLPCNASIAKGARVPVVAARSDGLVGAALVGVATISGTGVAVVAVHRDTTGTGTGHTALQHGTGILVITQRPRVGCHNLADSRLGGTLGRLAGPRNRVANHHRLGVDDALVGKLYHIAHQGAIAQVTVFQDRTITILHAITRQQETLTTPLRARIGHGARVPIVAGQRVGFKVAAARFITGIVGAWVFIVALHQSAHTDIANAKVSYRARVPVLALCPVVRHIQAPSLAGTTIHRTIVAIIAESDKLPLGKRWFICVPVAIIVQAIAHLLHGGLRVAIGQTVGGANPLPRTNPPCVGHAARRHQPQGRRAVRAGTNAPHSDALGRGCAIDGRAFMAGKAKGTIVIAQANAPAKTPLLPVVQAGILCTANADAVKVGAARLTQVGIAGHADKFHVGPATANLPAGPTGGTLLDAVLGTGPIAEMLHTPARLAVTVLLTVVTETALTRQASQPNVKLAIDDVRCRQIQNSHFLRRLHRIFACIKRIVPVQRVLLRLNHIPGARASRDNQHAPQYQTQSHHLHPRDSHQSVRSRRLWYGKSTFAATLECDRLSAGAAAHNRLGSD
jgi:hypothetical protein